MSDYIGLYIHIPFCKSKCPYCDFYSIIASEKKSDDYTELLSEKIKLWSRKINKKVSTIYFGGGTPSVLGTDRICKILNTVKNFFTLIDDVEITVEVNPESGRNMDFKKLYNCGINRISVGMESANEKELKALGRIHSANDVKDTVKNAKEAGIQNISLDLMMGIPYQTVESLKKSIDFCIECDVTHISAYILKIEDNTIYGKKKDTLVLPDDDLQAEMYLESVKYLESLNFEQYEISNFAEKGFESKHNSNYWKLADYIGIGPSAHSFVGGKRFYYGRSIQDFKNDVVIDDGDGGNEEEFIMLSLRLKSGLNFEEYRKFFGKPLPGSVLAKAKNHAESGFMIIDEEKISFTPKGFLVSNSIIADLI